MRRLRRERRDDARLRALIASAAVDYLCGEEERTRMRLSEAVALAEETEQPLVGASAALRLAELTADLPGQRAAESSMTELGVVDPPRYADVHAPGFTRGPQA